MSWAVAEEAAEYEVVDPDAVYWGEGDSPRRPAVIVADDVWLEIPEYKRILDEGLSDDDAEYHLLMKKATARFAKALDKVAKRDGYDMIGEVGAIRAKGRGAKKIPDVTQEMIELVRRK